MKKKFWYTFSMLILLLAFAGTITSCKPKRADSDNLMDNLEYKKTSPEWIEGANIYKVNIGQYTPEGTFKNLQQQLPHIKEMGIEILWLSDIYSSKDYTKTNPAFGTETDFSNMVTEAHKLGMHVIINWVANKTSCENIWVKSHPDWYKKDSSENAINSTKADCKDTANLNYENPQLRRAMINSMAYWVKSADIDGFHCYESGSVPQSFWIHTRKAIDKIKPDCFFIAGDDQPQAQKAFDATFDGSLKDIMTDIVNRKKNTTDLIKHLEHEAKICKTGNIRLLFTDNSYNKSENEQIEVTPIEAFTVFTYTIPGIPLTYSVKGEVITKLNQLKRGNTTLWSNTYNASFMGLRNTCPNSVLSYIRFHKKTQVFCLFNFSDKEQTFKIADEIKGEFVTYMGETVPAKQNEEMKLKPWSYSVQVAKQ